MLHKGYKMTKFFSSRPKNDSFYGNEPTTFTAHIGVEKSRTLPKLCTFIPLYTGSKNLGDVTIDFSNPTTTPEIVMDVKLIANNSLEDISSCARGVAKQFSKFSINKDYTEFKDKVNDEDGMFKFGIFPDENTQRVFTDPSPKPANYFMLCLRHELDEIARETVLPIDGIVYHDHGYLEEEVSPTERVARNAAALARIARDEANKAAAHIVTATQAAAACTKATDLARAEVRIAHAEHAGDAEFIARAEATFRTACDEDDLALARVASAAATARTRAEAATRADDAAARAAEAAARAAEAAVRAPICGAKRQQEDDDDDLKVPLTKVVAKLTGHRDEFVTMTIFFVTSEDNQIDKEDIKKQDTKCYDSGNNGKPSAEIRFDVLRATNLAAYININKSTKEIYEKMCDMVALELAEVLTECNIALDDTEFIEASVCEDRDTTPVHYLNKLIRKELRYKTPRSKRPHY